MVGHRCHSCNTTDTPEWRRGPDGARTLCNACGLRTGLSFYVFIQTDFFFFCTRLLKVVEKRIADYTNTQLYGNTTASKRPHKSNRLEFLTQHTHTLFCILRMYNNPLSDSQNVCYLFGYYTKNLFFTIDFCYTEAFWKFSI